MHKRNDFLDVLKGILIFFILITHYSWTSQERVAYFFPFWIDMAVPVFMIISGYVNALSFKKNSIASFKMAYNPWLLLQKTIRYTVPYGIVFLAEGILYSLRGNDVPWIVGFLTGGFGPGSYYYPILIQFILVFPVIYCVIRRYHAKGLILCGVFNVTFEVCHWAYGMNVECYRLLVFRYILVIAVGCYVALEERAFTRMTSISMTLVGAVFILACNYWGYTPKVMIHWTTTCVIACMFIIPVVAYGVTRVNFSGGFITIIGKASYNIFLVQMVYYQFYANQIYAMVDSRIGEILLGMIICSVLGITFYLIESPMTRKLINIVKAHCIIDGEMVNG